MYTLFNPFIYVNRRKLALNFRIELALVVWNLLICAKGLFFIDLVELGYAHVLQKVMKDE